MSVSSWVSGVGGIDTVKVNGVTIPGSHKTINVVSSGATGAEDAQNGQYVVTIPGGGGGGGDPALGGDLSGTASNATVATVGGASAASLAAHPGETNNPHGVTAAQAGAEPAGAVAAHTALSNPHGTDAGDVGADPAGSAAAAQSAAESTAAAALAAHAADANAHHVPGGGGSAGPVDPPVIFASYASPNPAEAVTTTDGVTFADITSNVSDVAECMTSGKGVAVVGGDGFIQYTIDGGASWASATVPVATHQYLQAIYLTQFGRFVLAGLDSAGGPALATSQNGKDWVDASGAVPGSVVNGLAKGPSGAVVLAGAGGTGGNGLAISYDGCLSWTSAVAFTDQQPAYGDVEWCGTAYVSVVGSGDNQLARSPDGATWSAGTLHAGTSDDVPNANGIAYSPALGRAVIMRTNVALGAFPYYSDDGGVTWATDGALGFSPVAYVSWAPSLGAFFAVQNDNSSSSRIMRSTDGAAYAMAYSSPSARLFVATNAPDVGASLPAGESGGGASGVTTFEGRSGAVTAQAGDYTPAQVGAEPAGAVATHEGLPNPHGTSAGDVGAEPAGAVAAHAGAAGAHAAQNISFDNTASGLAASDAKAAIDEVAAIAVSSGSVTPADPSAWADDWWQGESAVIDGSGNVTSWPSEVAGDDMAPTGTVQLESAARGIVDPYYLPSSSTGGTKESVKFIAGSLTATLTTAVTGTSPLYLAVIAALNPNAAGTGAHSLMSVNGGVGMVHAVDPSISAEISTLAGPAVLGAGLPAMAKYFGPMTMFELFHVPGTGLTLTINGEHVLTGTSPEFLGDRVDTTTVSLGVDVSGNPTFTGSGRARCASLVYASAIPTVTQRRAWAAHYGIRL